MPFVIPIVHLASAVAALFLFAGQAPAQDRRCLSIQNVDERIDCLESRGASFPTPSSPSRSEELLVGPSFDCRAASHSIERAICGDETLSEWDRKMSRQYKEALRVRSTAEAQAVVETQRSWIQRRNNLCGAVAGQAVWSCVLNMTKQRIAILSEAPQTETLPPAPQSNTTAQQPLTQPPLKNQGAPSANISTTPQPSLPLTVPSQTSAAPLTKTTSNDSNPLLVLLFVIGTAIAGVSIFQKIKRHERRQRLVAKYGEEIAERILAKQVWQGMTDDQLVESWGNPVDRDREIKRTKTKETWKYGQTGKNRFSNRVYLEDGIVIGWKQ